MECGSVILAGKQIFRGLCNFHRIDLEFFVFWALMFMLLHDIKFWMSSSDMIEPSCSVLFFLSSIHTQKIKQTLKFHNETSTSITDFSRVIFHFLRWKVCNKLKLNLCTCSFPLWKEGFCFHWSFFCLLFIKDTLPSGDRTFSLDETDSSF